jgi:hypothetical protein
MCRTLGKKVIWHLPSLHLEKLKLLSLTGLFSLALTHIHRTIQNFFTDVLSVVISFALNSSINVMDRVSCLQTPSKQ